MRLLLDEMYGSRLAESLRSTGIDAATIHEHHGLLIALSSRFSRRPSGAESLQRAIIAVADAELDDRVIYLEP